MQHPKLGLLVIALAGACGDNKTGEPITTDQPDAAVVLPKCSESDLLGMVQHLPSVAAASEVACGQFVRGTARCFAITMNQPIEHSSPDGASYPQHLFLAHRGCDRPMLVA